MAWAVFFFGWKYSIIFHDFASDIERRHASRPDMDDDALDTSEYDSDARSFRALRKRKSKNDSAAGSGESCNKNKAVELLPVILESKSGNL